MSRIPEPVCCILCGCPMNRVIFVPNEDDWRRLADLGVVQGDAMIVPLCIIHRATKNLANRVGDAVIAVSQRAMRRSS